MMSLQKPYSFDWDIGNEQKNLLRHNVTKTEAEEVFWDTKKILLPDTIHSKKEERHILLGTSRSGRQLFIVFTLRKENVRIISCRELNKRERKMYEEKTYTSKI